MRFNEDRFAQEYERRLAKEGYPGSLLDIIKYELGDVKTVIDIGAGTGFFTIPLAHEGYEMHAVEPSKKMLNYLDGKISDEIANRIHCYNINWEDWQIDKKDAAICIHSIYPMKEPEICIEQMITYSDKRVLLVKIPDTQTLTGIMKNEFKPDKSNPDYVELIENQLNKHHISFTAKDLYQDRISSFEDINEWASYYVYFLKLDKTIQQEIEKKLTELTIKQHGVYSFKSTYHDIMYLF